MKITNINKQSKENLLNSKLQSEHAFGLVELLFSIGLIAIIALGVGANIVTTFRSHKSVLVSEALGDLAVERIERYSSINPLEMDNSSHDDNENNLKVPYISTIEFTRVTDITVNADSSRSVSVTVTCNHPSYTNKTLTLETTFIRW